MEKISIIIPCFNGEKTIRRCLDSVKAQTYPNFEVLFIDDGSTDQTRSIAQAYAREDSRIRVITCEQNRGVSSARNLGVRLAQGDYIQFMDADDEMLPEMLETLLDAIKKENADIAVSNFTGNPVFLAFFADRVYDLTVESDLLEYYQETFCVLLPWNKLYRREIVRVPFDEEVHFAEDELFNLAVLKHARKVVCVNKPLYIYHFGPAEQMRQGVPAEEKPKSCLNTIIENTQENSKNSIWYKASVLIPKRRAILEEELREGHLNFHDVEDLLYTRVFDFFFWEMSAFAYMKTPREGICNEVYNVLREPAFIRSVKVQEKYGLRYGDYDHQALKQRGEYFVDACLYTYKDIEANGKKMNFYYVFLMLFLRLFCDLGEKRSLEYNQLYKMMMQLRENTTKEAKYVNRIMGKALTRRKDATA